MFVWYSKSQILVVISALSQNDASKLPAFEILFYFPEGILTFRFILSAILTSPNKNRGIEGELISEKNVKRSQNDLNRFGGVLHFFRESALPRFPDFSCKS